MSRIIDSSNQTTTVGQRLSFKADIDFLQQDIRDCSSYIIESLIANYDSTKTYVLKGCELSSVGGTTTVTAGYIYGIKKTFGGLVNQAYIYYHPGSSYADPSGGNVSICRVKTTFSALDPTPFSDGNDYNVHQINTIEFLAGASGSGDINFSNLIFPYAAITTFGLGFGNNTYLHPKCYKTGNIVKLEGRIDFTTGLGGTFNIGTLPTGFIPSPLGDRMFAVPFADGGGNSIVFVTIDNTGAINLSGGLLSTNGTLDIGSISFSI